MIKNVFFCIEFFIDSAGFVHFLGRDLTITSFQAYEIRVSHFYQLKQQNFLFTVGVSFLTYVSIWHLCIKSNHVFFNFDKLYKSKWQMCTNLLLGNYPTHTHTATSAEQWQPWTAFLPFVFQANFKVKYPAGTCTCTPTMKYTSSPPPPTPPQKKTNNNNNNSNICTVEYLWYMNRCSDDKITKLTYGITLWATALY